MIQKSVYFAVAVLALVTLACGLTINLPVEQIEAGPAQTKEIYVEEPAGPIANVRISFGAGELNISPGAEGALVVGEATYNVDRLEPEITVKDEDVRIETGEMDFTGFPRIGSDLINRWELRMGEMPMDLVINAGAYQGDIELGGLALKSLSVSDGAADARLRFSQPNLIEMDSLRYITGASNVRLSGLANANFSSMVFRSGAGDYTLDFSGKLQRDAAVTIESGISKVLLVVPEGMNAKVFFKGGLANVEVSGDWQSSGDQYFVEGEGPQLIINVEMGAGSLELDTD